MHLYKSHTDIYFVLTDQMYVHFPSNDLVDIVMAYFQVACCKHYSRNMIFHFFCADYNAVKMILWKIQNCYSSMLVSHDYVLQH